MRHVLYTTLIILILMSFTAGVAKVAATDQEVQFFANAGIAKFWLLPLGIMQIAGALAAAYHKSRRRGLAIVGLGFLASSIIIFMTGNTAFGLISLFPIALCFAVGACLPLSLKS